MAGLRDSWRTSLRAAQQPWNPQPESIARTPYDIFRDGKVPAALGANPLAATPVDPARRDALMAGLAEALETFKPTQPRPAIRAASVELPRAPTPVHRY